jgi:hypothetical protein
LRKISEQSLRDLGYNRVVEFLKASCNLTAVSAVQEKRHGEFEESERERERNLNQIESQTEIRGQIQ